MPPAEARKSPRWPYAVGAVCLSLALIAVVFWTRIDPNPRILARLEVKNGSFLVVQRADGKANVLLSDWSVELWWRRSGGWWACYALDYETGPWTDVMLHENSDHLVVTRGGRTVGNLNLVDYSLMNLQRNTVGRPAFVTKDDPLLVSNRSRVYPESKDWQSAWAGFTGYNE